MNRQVKCDHQKVEDGEYVIKDAIQIFTQVIAENAINVVAMSLNDFGEDCAIENVHLASTGAPTLLQLMETPFTTDAAGKMLDLKVVADGLGIVAVLAQRGPDGEVYQAPFVQIPVPAVGTFVTLNGQMGIIKKIPTAMIIAGDPESLELDQSGCNYEPSGDFVCTFRSPVDMPGLVDVEIVLDSNGCVVHPSRGIAVPVMFLEEAEQDQIVEYNITRTTWEDNVVSQLQNAIQEVADILRKNPASKQEGGEMARRIHELKHFITETQACHPNLVRGTVSENQIALSQMDAQIARFARTVRFL